MGTMLRILLGLMILVLGVVAAAPFQRSEMQPQQPRATDSELVWRRPDATTMEIVAAPETELAPVVVQSRSERPPEVRSPAVSPSMESSFHEIPSVTRPPAVRAKVLGLAAEEADDPAKFDEIRHRLIDGDELRTLAERYLGSAERWREIFEANRDVLEDPEVLPLGVELSIPQ